MLLHYIKMAVRQLLKYKFHTIVAALCMAIGLTINGYMGSIVLTEFNIIGKLCISKKGNPGETNWLTGDEYKQVVEKGVEGIEGFYCHSLSHYQSVGYTENDEQRHEVYIRCISNDYFRNAIERVGNMILEGKDSIGEGEIIVSKGLANKVFGRESPIGKSLTIISDSIYGENSFTGKSYRIAGVCEPISRDDVTSFVYAPMIHNDTKYIAWARKKSGYSDKELIECAEKTEFKSSKDGAPFKLFINPYNSGPAFIIGITLYTSLSLLIFVTGLISFMKFMIQIFYTRQRELALRKCMGSNNRGLYMLLACEVVLMLGLSFFLSCIFTELSTFYFAYMDIVPSLDGKLGFMSLIGTQLLTTLVAIAISMVIILFPILKLRRVGMKESMLRHRRGTKARYTLIGLQFAVSIIFFILLGLSVGMQKFERSYFSDNLSDKEQDRIIALSVTKRNWEDIRMELEKLPQVENFVYCDNLQASRDCIVEKKLNFANDSVFLAVVGSGDPRIFEFFNIEVQGNIVEPEQKNYVYIDRMLHERVLKEKDFDGTLTIDDRKYRVAGIIEKEFLYEGQSAFIHGEGYRQLSGAIFLPETYNRIFYYRLKEGVSVEEGKKAFEKVYRKYIPETFDINISTFRERIHENEKESIFITHLCYLMAIISLLVVVLSIYSSISLDAATRQKEIAIRKINGARGRDIFSHFITPYIITYAVTFIIIYPAVTNLVGLAVDQANVHDIFPMSLIAIHCATVFVGTIALLTITSWHKIKNIMSINPADVIRKE